MERRYNNRAAEIISENGRMIKGYASTFESMYEMYPGYNETIARGAFDGCDMSDVVALFNHESEMLLARTKDGVGTLTLRVDDKGLYFEFEALNTTMGNDVLENIKAGNIRGCSFAFTVSEQKVEEFADGSCLRTILKIDKLYDVGPVVNPAYEDTEVEAYKKRNRELIKKEDTKTINESYYIAKKFKFNLN
jgi:hypothetical protein